MQRMSYGVVTLILGCALGSVLIGHGQPQPQPAAQPRELISYRDIVKRILPAVVSIETRAKPGSRFTPDPNLPPALQGDPNRLGYGSGFFADARGSIVTNYHVVEGAELAVVHLLDGRKFTSRDIRVDRRTDLAVIMLDVKDAPFLELGDSAAMEIGDRVLAVGAPFGLTGSVTHGIISAKGRAGLQMNMYEDFLQTDAAINPGNSGGPLVNLDGRVVGINAAIKSKSGGFQGVGLAVASNLAKSVVEQLRTTGTVKRGYVGGLLREITFDVATRLGLPRGAGVVVAEVFPNTPAAKAKLLPGDIITAVAGKAIKDGQAMQNVINALTVNTTVEFELIRDGKALRLNVTIEEQPAEFGATGLPIARNVLPFPASSALPALGIDVSDLSDDLADDLGYRRSQRGALITRVADGSIASDNGLRRGMVIARVGQVPIAGAADLIDAMRSADLAKGVVVQVVSPQGGVNYLLLRR